MVHIEQAVGYSSPPFYPAEQHYRLQMLHHSQLGRPGKIEDGRCAQFGEAQSLRHEQFPFPTRLHEMLDNADRRGFEDVVSWQAGGRSFKVHQADRFATDVMGLFFNQTKFKSFQRQLNLYGFQRIHHGQFKGGYAHEMFVQGRQDLSLNIARQRTYFPKGSTSAAGGGKGDGKNNCKTLSPPRPSTVPAAPAAVPALRADERMDVAMSRDSDPLHQNEYSMSELLDRADQLADAILGPKQKARTTSSFFADPTARSYKNSSNGGIDGANAFTGTANTNTGEVCLHQSLRFDDDDSLFGGEAAGDCDMADDISKDPLYCSLKGTGSLSQLDLSKMSVDFDSSLTLPFPPRSGSFSSDAPNHDVAIEHAIIDDLCGIFDDDNNNSGNESDGLDVGNELGSSSGRSSSGNPSAGFVPNSPCSAHNGTASLERFAVPIPTVARSSSSDITTGFSEGSSRNRPSTQHSFPWKLHDLLEDAERDGFSDVVSWNASGTTFKVHKSSEFVSRVMPLYFDQTKYESFRRQLNLYNFNRITRGPLRGTYLHDQFIRADKSLCASIQREARKSGSDD